MNPKFLYVGVAVNHSYGTTKWISQTTPAYETVWEVKNAIDQDDIQNWKIVRVRK